jgi:hypothetical protein
MKKKHLKQIIIQTRHVGLLRCLTHKKMNIQLKKKPE